MVSILTYLVRRLGAPPSPAALAALSLVALTVCSMAGDQMIRPLAALVSWLASRAGARSYRPIFMEMVLVFSWLPG